MLADMVNEGKTLNQIAEQMNLSKQRVHQLLKREGLVETYKAKQKERLDKKHTRNCPICGKDFLCPDIKHRKKYCSKECMRAGIRKSAEEKRPNVILVCKNPKCGKEFIKPRRQYSKSYKGLFCSLKCYHDSGQRVKIYSDKEYKCFICKAPFIVSGHAQANLLSRLRKENREGEFENWDFSCSPACRNKAWRLKKLIPPT